MHGLNLLFINYCNTIAEMKSCCSAIFFLLSFSLLEAQILPAFPGAQGFGSSTIGGRGGKVIEVLNLNAKGEGSLAQALYTKGPRTIVFRTGGSILLTKDIFIDEPFVTIAGQTAPGDGICIRGAAIRIRTHDVLMRNLRFRVGDSLVGPDPDNRDGLAIENSLAETDSAQQPYNIIIDHCSVSWAIDENISFWYPCHDITLQNCLISEGLHHSLHTKDTNSLIKSNTLVGHSTGLLLGWGEKHISIHHNLFAHNNGRNPNIHFDAEAELVNNVVYNWGDWEGTVLSNWENFDLPFAANIIGNVYKPLQYISAPISLSPNTKPGSKIFIENNISPDLAKLYPELYSATNNWWLVNVAKVDTEKCVVRSPAISPSNIVVDDANEVYAKVLADVGATRPVSDFTDARVIKSVREGSGKIIDKVSDVGGWPFYASGLPPEDDDHDGIPNDWEDVHGLNKYNYEDAIHTNLSNDGYTNIEMYINGLFDLVFTSVPSEPASKNDFSFSIYPSPCSEKTNISFFLKEDAQVCLNIFDLQGRLAENAVNCTLQAGLHNSTWDVSVAGETQVSNGMYFAVLKVNGYQQTKALVVQR